MEKWKAAVKKKQIKNVTDSCKSPIKKGSYKLCIW